MSGKHDGRTVNAAVQHELSVLSAVFGSANVRMVKGADPLTHAVTQYAGIIFPTRNHADLFMKNEGARIVAAWNRQHPDEHLTARDFMECAKLQARTNFMGLSVPAWAVTLSGPAERQVHATAAFCADTKNCAMRYTNMLGLTQAELPDDYLAIIAGDEGEAMRVARQVNGSFKNRADGLANLFREGQGEVVFSIGRAVRLSRAIAPDSNLRACELVASQLQKMGYTDIAFANS